MTRPVLALVPALLVAACATPPPPPPEPTPVVAAKPKAAPPSPLPAEPQVVVTRLEPDAAFERIRQRLHRQGFMFEAPIRPDPGGKATTRIVARSTRILVRGPDSEPLCGGTTEVLQAAVEAAERGSVLRISCYTAKLADIAPGASQCTQTPVPGCPEKGERLVGEIALDAISFL